MTAFTGFFTGERQRISADIGKLDDAFWANERTQLTLIWADVLQETAQAAAHGSADPDQLAAACSARAAQMAETAVNHTRSKVEAAETSQLPATLDTVTGMERVSTIAVNETVWAWGEGEALSLAQSDQDEYIEWHSANDDHVDGGDRRGICARLNGRVTKVGEPFTFDDGTIALDVFGQPLYHEGAHPGCRCRTTRRPQGPKVR